jgi:hypothetical protein
MFWMPVAVNNFLAREQAVVVDRLIKDLRVLGAGYALTVYSEFLAGVWVVVLLAQTSTDIIVDIHTLDRMHLADVTRYRPTEAFQ